MVRRSTLVESWDTWLVPILVWCCVQFDPLTTKFAARTMAKGTVQKNADGSTTTITEVKTNYLYEEEYQPWFVWTLILAPCLMPVVWYVNRKRFKKARIHWVERSRLERPSSPQDRLFFILFLTYSRFLFD
jgi:hypothetical protein